MNAFRFISLRGLAAAAALTAWTITTPAQIPLADQPVFTSVNVPGNLALALSVEYPTAISVAHPNNSYSSANTYIGYFDPLKCYAYRYTDGTGLDNYFYPVAVATDHTCSSQWSGNFLNWATMQTIDPFRWALTGGYRITDTPQLTVLEKAYASSQGGTGNFPDRTLAVTSVPGATPFPNTQPLSTRIWNLGNKIRFQTPGPAGLNGASFTGSYWNNKTFTGTATATRTDGNINYNINNKWFPSGINTTNVSAKWTGTVTAPSAGTYSFKARADDGVRLTVRVNNSGPTYSLNDTGWRDQPATDYLLSVPNVSANDTLNITMEYYQGGGGGEVSLQWQTPGTTGYTIVGGTGNVDLYAGTATHYNPNNALVAGTLYEAFVRVKVCDAGLGVDKLEGNCTLYSNGNYKPTGLMQKYSDKIRYSAFGYLNDSNLSRDGGVLRAKQKFIGPTMPVPGGLPVSNARGEWDASTGVMVTNPDAADATAMSQEPWSITISNSGVMNYLNKFGEIERANGYKMYDPVSELYYGVQRYFRKLGNVPAWTSPGSADATAKAKLADGFPVITNWDDPIKYSCQRNFILGIGDVNTHADRNLPGATGSSEPAKPTEVSSDTGVNALDWTNKVGVLQGIDGLGSAQNYGGCCNNNGALMAGLAYWANVNDIRPDDLDGKQTIQTYWLDVLEYQTFKPNNQFYLAAKYGGFSVPPNFRAETALPSQFANNATTKSWWSTTTDTVADGSPRPDNYYSAAQADQMVTGLTKAFSSIASQLSAYSTSFSTALPQVSALGVAAYSTKYDAKTWTGELIASQASFDVETGLPTLRPKWSFSDTLATQASGTGWDVSRNIVTFNPSSRVGTPFRKDNLTAGQVAALRTGLGSNDDAANYINYVRGDRTNERSSTSSGSTRLYRDRASLIGDIVNAKARPVGPPAAPYSDSYNPGYSAFKTARASRTPMVYVATNAGMVHAVNGNLTGTSAGREVWAYVPNAVIGGPTATPQANGLASVGNPDFVHHFLVDASPMSIDIDFGRTSGGSGTADWRTLLIGGFGKGGKALYALDITNPDSVTNETTAATKVLWEFTHPDLGYTFGQPVVVKTRKYGWVIVIGSGYNNGSGSTAGKGFFFFINPRTGELLEKVAAPCSDCSSSNQAGLAHVNAFVLDLSDGVADAIYGGDLMGNLWRLNVTGSGAYPDAVKIATLTGSDGNPLPVTTKPLPVVQPGTNRRYITVGTGRLLDSSDLNNAQAQRFFAIIDGSNAGFSNDGIASGTTSTLPEGLRFPLTVRNMRQLTDMNSKIALDLRTEVGWYVDLGVSAGGTGWRVLTDPASFYGTVAFAATSPTSTDPCSPNGSSRIYAIDLGSGYCSLTDGGSGCFVNSTNGIVIDLQFYSINVNGVGKSALVAGGNLDRTGQSAGQQVPRTRRPPALGLHRLNWREIVINN